MTARNPLPEQFDGRAFGVGRARDAGVGEHRLAAKDLTAPFHAVRMPAEALADVRTLAAAYATVMPSHHFFSHATAAALHGMRWPRAQRTLPLHVTATADRAPRGSGVRGHRSDRPVNLVEVSGLRVSDPAATWAACASTLSVSGLVILGDGLLARRGALSTFEALDDVIAWASGTRGATKLRAARSDIRAGTDSAKETDLRLTVIGAGFPEPEVNGPITDSSGRIRFHGDLVFREQRLIVEYEGRHHATDPMQFSIDIARINTLRRWGWTVLRVDAALLRDRAALIALLADFLPRVDQSR